jgi:phosphotransferase system HPr (HPr) family protein
MSIFLSGDDLGQSECEKSGQEICEIEVEIRNAAGMHMRPAMQFADIANQFDAEITVSNAQTSVDAKSIMQMSMLAATCGTKLKVTAKGTDAKEAVEALRELVEVKKFDEPAPGEEK